MSEEELVNKILNNVNPKIAGSLRGTVHSVEQLVKIGSLVEKDCMSIKDYWQKVNDQAGKDKINKRGSNKPVAPSMSAGLSVIQRHHHRNQINPASLLVVLFMLSGWQVEAVVDTGSAFTLMQESRWKEIAGMHDEIQNVKQNFVMADGKMHQSKGQVELKYEWHQERGKVEVYIMEDSHLVFPVVLGLDFLTRVGATFDFSQLCYKLPSKRGDSGYPFICSQQPSFIQGSGNQMIGSHPRSNLSLYYPITEEQSYSFSRTRKDVPGMVDGDLFPPEVQQLMQEWPDVTSGKLGKTSVVKHQIQTSDEVPVKSRAYRVSPFKKKIIEEEVEKMLKENIIEPSLSPWSSPVVLVEKTDGTFRFCVDYRKVNSKTISDAYPMPLIHEILESLDGATWFSAL